MIQRALMLGVVIAALAAGAGADELFVPADGSVITTSPLVAGRSYMIEARGTYGYRDVVPEKIADAEWVYSVFDGAWIETPSGGDLDLFVDGTDISMMGTEDGEVFSPHFFSPGHVYRAVVFGAGAPVELSIYDERYDDNTGGLNVTVRPAATGDTNVDDIVDMRDCDNLIAQFGGPPSDLSADFNGDGVVNLVDFALQRANFGLGAVSGPADRLGPVAPEPASLLVTAGGFCVLLNRKRNRKPSCCVAGKER
ncbi:MAG: hypothetical protein QGG42_15250 [Phycisphaerae bacterium]|jgi:hypothetical protein|nr:hypothetical protein [Phycisphaerae bacterium]